MLHGTNGAWWLEFPKSSHLQIGFRISMWFQSSSLLLLLYLDFHGIQQSSSRNHLCWSERLQAWNTNSSNIRRTSSQNPITVPTCATFLLRISADKDSNLLCLTSADPINSDADRFLPHTTSFIGCMDVVGGHGREISTGRISEAMNHAQIIVYTYHSCKLWIIYKMSRRRENLLLIQSV